MAGSSREELSVGFLVGGVWKKKMRCQRPDRQTDREKVGKQDIQNER